MTKPTDGPNYGTFDMDQQPNQSVNQYTKARESEANDYKVALEVGFLSLWDARKKEPDDRNKNAFVSSCEKIALTLYRELYKVNLSEKQATKDWGNVDIRTVRTNFDTILAKLKSIHRHDKTEDFSMQVSILRLEQAIQGNDGLISRLETCKSADLSAQSNTSIKPAL